jgi:hypothetical protein
MIIEFIDETSPASRAIFKSEMSSKEEEKKD